MDELAIDSFEARKHHAVSAVEGSEWIAIWKRRQGRFSR